MHKEYIEVYRKIADRINAEFADESRKTSSLATKKLRISKYHNGTRVDFLAIDHKVEHLNKVSYTRPYSGIFIPIINKFDYKLEIVSKFGFDFLKAKLSKKYVKSNYSNFDRKFLIKCNEPSLVAKSLKNESTRTFLKKNQQFKMGIQKKDGTFGNRGSMDQDFFYIEQDHWVDDANIIDSLLNISGAILYDLTNSGLVELENPE